MFKVIVLVALFAIVYSLPSPANEAEQPQHQASPAEEEIVKATNGEIESKHEKEALEGAESGWGWKKWGWSYPVRKVHYYPVRVHYYPVHHYPVHHHQYHGHGHGHHYQTYKGWW